MITNSESALFIKKILDLKKTNYVELAQRLNRMGIMEDNSNLSNKINRGTFSLTFTLQVVDVLGLELIAVPKTFENSKISVDKDKFIEKYIQTSKMLKKAENKFVLELVNNARKELLSAAGFMPEVIEHFEKNCNETKRSENKEDVSSLYDELSNLNVIAKEALNLVFELKRY